MERVTASDYIVASLRKGKCNIFAQGEGGIGKTTSLLQCYCYLLDEAEDDEGKMMIPIFIPISACEENDAFAIRRFFLSKYTDEEEYILDEKTAFLNLQKLFEAKGMYRFVFLVDGLNEKYRGDMLLSEIGTLSQYENVSLVVTGREYKKAFDGWKRVTFLPLPEETVSKFIGESPVEKSVSSLLRIPFYLDTYLKVREMGEKDNEGEGAITGAYHLLEQYIEFSVNKLLHANTYEMTEQGELTKTIQTIMTEWCPRLCFEMARSGGFEVSLFNMKLKESVGALPSGKQIDMNFACRSILMPLGIMSENGTLGFKISHQIYRDYFASRYLHMLFEEFEYTVEMITDYFCEEIPSDVLKFLVESFEESEAEVLMRRFNRWVQREENRRQHAVLQKNIIELCGFIRPILEGDFSFRNMTRVSFEPFARISADFTGAHFGPLAFSYLSGITYWHQKGWDTKHSLYDFVVFPEIDSVVYKIVHELHRVNLNDGRDVLLDGWVWANEGGKFDEHTYYYKQVSVDGKDSVHLIDVQTGDEKSIDVGETESLLKKRDDTKECTEGTPDKINVQGEMVRMSYSEHEVYMEENTGSGKKVVWRTEEVIQQLIVAKNRLLLVTGLGIRCLGYDIVQGLQEVWFLHTDSVEKTPFVMNGQLFFQMRKPDQTKSWAHVFTAEDGTPRVKILKCFEKDAKKPIYMSESLCLFSESGNGILYTIDEQTMTYKTVVDFNEASRTGEYRCIAEPQKAVSCKDREVILQVNMILENSGEKFLEFYKGNLNGFERLFSRRNTCDVQTLLTEDMVVLWEDSIDGTLDNFFVISYDGTVQDACFVRGADERRLCSDGKNVYFWQGGQRYWDGIDYYDIVERKRGTMRVKWSKLPFGVNVVFEEGINQLLFYWDAPVDDESPEYSALFDIVREENELTVGSKIVNCNRKFMAYVRDGKRRILLDGQEEVTVSEENTGRYTYPSFIHDLSGSVFKDTKGLLEEELEILRRYGAKVI